MNETVLLLIDEIEKYCKNSYFWIIWGISFLYLFVKNKSFRERVGYPMVIMFVFIFNPLLYEPLWKKLVDATFWRLFWLLQENIICVYALLYFLQTCKHRIKYLLLCALVVFILFCGGNVYQERFSIAENPYKIPQNVISVCDKLLEKDDTPFIVAPASLFHYIRQYTNDINMLYGRDVLGYTIHVTEWDYVQLYREIKKSHPDYDLVGHLSRRHQVEYIVLKRKDKKQQMEKYGYFYSEKVGKFYIYETVQSD